MINATKKDTTAITNNTLDAVTNPKSLNTIAAANVIANNVIAITPKFSITFESFIINNFVRIDVLTSK